MSYALASQCDVLDKHPVELMHALRKIQMQSMHHLYKVLLCDSAG